MKVLVINSNNTLNPIPVMPAGACMVAESAERAGHNVRFLDLTFEKYPVDIVRREVARFSPEAIGISVRNIDNNQMPSPSSCYKNVKKITDTIRDISKATVILGGTALGIMPEAYLSLTGAECAVTGPGETVFPKILNCLDNGTPFEGLDGVVTLANIKQCNSSDSEVLPKTPDFRRWLDTSAYISRLASAPVQSKRGCPFECVYCSTACAKAASHCYATPWKL